MTLELLNLEYLPTHPDGYRYSAFCGHYRRWPAQQRIHAAFEICLPATTVNVLLRDALGTLMLAGCSLGAEVQPRVAVMATTTGISAA